jgi:hypothetical protein
MNDEKIQKLIRMLSSPNDGEIVAAARAILRTLEAEGTDIHDLAERVSGRKLSEAEMKIIYDRAYRDGKKAAAANTGFSDVNGSGSSAGPSWHAMALEIQHKADGRLNPKEQGFVDDMVRWCARREPSEKQGKWLHSIYCRISRR